MSRLLVASGDPVPTLVGRAIGANHDDAEPLLAQIDVDGLALQGPSTLSQLDTNR